MAKRKNRLPALDHEMRQLEKLKTLEPIATSERWRAFSDQLFDIALAALGTARVLESGKRPGWRRLRELVELVNGLPDLAPRKSDGEGENGEET